MLRMQQVVAAVIFGDLGWTFRAKKHYDTRWHWYHMSRHLYLGQEEDQQSGVHLGINILSTLLLGSSKLLHAAPTQAEVHKAHKKSVWLGIGALSVEISDG